MSSSHAIQVERLSKCYRLYNRPKDRLKQIVVPRLQRLAGRSPTAYFSEFWALRDLDLTVKRGETLGIIGRNGSGKSTLLQLLCGTLVPTMGTIDVNGRIAALLELGAGFHPEFTGRENVYMNGALLGLTRNEIDERFDDITAFSEIGGLIDQPVKTYSSGMYVRLAFAVITHVRADILFIDEALAVGDAFFVQKCMRFLRAFREQGTIILVTHDTGAVVNLCTRAIWLDRGMLHMEGRPKDVCRAYLASQYGSTSHRPTGLYEAAGRGEADLTEGKRNEGVDPRGTPPQPISLVVGRFEAHGPSFGSGKARIVDVSLMDEKDAPLAWVGGGERVTVCVRVRANQDIPAPIVGFFLQDRLGQVLFGENTYVGCRDHPASVRAGEEIESRFTFHMPFLPAGDYPVAVAVADGTQAEHVQHHWMHEALVIRSLASGATTGLIGLPMLDVSIRVNKVAA